jgi:hypothetical protein
LTDSDPLLDRLLALRRNSEAQRARWQLAPTQTLVTVTSTWGSGSTLGRWPDLPTHLIADLPYDEFRVAAVLHPNVWSHHGHWQIRHWLRRAQAAGLILLDPTGGWPAAIAVADCIIGDHGSLSAYATGLGLPVLIAAFNDIEVPPESAMADLGKIAPRLHDQRPLADQIREAVRAVDHDAVAALADRVFQRRGESLAILQNELYRLLGLPTPQYPPLPATSIANLPESEPPRSFQVESELAADSVVVVRRFPATVAIPEPGRRRHLAAAETDPDQRMPENAAIVFADATAGDHDPAGAARRLFASYPGCRVVGVPEAPDRMRLHVRAGGAVLATVEAQSDSAWDPQLAASAFYAVLMRGDKAKPVMDVQAGRMTATVRFTQVR